VIAHVGALPLEEVLPLLTGAGGGLLAVRARIMARVRRRRRRHAFVRDDFRAAGRS
jgi:hypothetical protein